MSEPLRSDVDLQLLFRKLGHDVEEIRVRSLRNILSKLSHGLICEADLVQERHLLVRLLEWFNFSDIPCQEDVLNLIHKLAKHGSSAQIFVELGAVRFLSQLRPDSSDNLHPLIDDIIETLLSLPSQDVGILQQKKECVYQHQEQKHTGDAEDMASTRHTTIIQEVPSLQPNQGYFATHDSIAVALPCQPEQGIEGVCGLKFCTFPWLSLTHTDRHVLLSTNSLLCSSRPSLVATSCEFISDVVLQDFPAEIFLQRPSIIKSLLSLLGVKPLGDNDSDIPVGAARCLRDLAVLIMARYRFYHDPSLYCPKQEFGSVPSSSYTSSSGRASQATSQSTLSSNSRPSVIGRNEPRLRGDGQDRDSPSSVGSSPVVTDPSLVTDSETDSEDALSLQFSQLTLPQFVVETMTKILPVLKTTNPEVMLAGMQLLEELIKLIQVSVTTDIWEDKSVAGRNLTEKLLESLEFLGEAIEFHHEYSGVNDASALSIRHHRMANIVLAACTLQVLQAMVPLSKCSDIVPDSLISGISLIVMDQSLVYSIPQARTVLGGYLEKLDNEKYQMYQKAMELCEALERSQTFLKEAKVKEELLPLACASLPGLPYHPDLTFVKQFIKIYSQMCRYAEKDESILTDGRKTLLKLLAHPEVNIRLETYESCTNIVKKCVNVDEAAKPHSDASLNVRFLADPSVLYEMSCFGLNDGNKDICRCASDIVLHLLQGKLLMQTHVWQESIQAIVPSLPILQSIASRETTLSRCILGLYEAPLVSSGTSDEAHILPKLEKFRGALRLFFSKDESIRHEAARCVLWHLTQDPDRGRKLPSVSNPVLTDMADIYLMEYPVVLDDSRERSVFQVDGLVKVYNIYKSSETEPSLKKSAAEQIAIMLQDVTLHKAFISNGGIDNTLAYLKEAVDSASNKQVAMATLIPACLSILRHVLHEDSSLRHQLAHQSDIYYLILRCTLLCKSDSRVKYQGAHLMVLLLFDEAASLSTSPDDKHPRFALPRCVIQRYQLPFRCPTSQTTSVNCIDKLPQPDPMMEPLPLGMMKITWNVAKHAGIDELVKYLDANRGEEGQSIESTPLYLNKAEQLVLKESYIKHSLSHSLTAITQATSHHQVKLSLWHLSLWLTAGLLMDSDDGGFPLSPCGQFLMLDWKDVLKRFVEVIPVNSDDKLLLTEVLRFLTNLMQSLKFVPEDLRDWLGDISCGSKSVLMNLLSNYAANHQGGGSSEQGVEDVVGRQGMRRPEEEGAPHTVLHKQLLTFFNTFVKCLPLCDAWRHKGRYLGGSLTHGLLTSLNMTDALPFYDLPPLEGTLNCLVHVTARSGWSLDWNEGDSLSLCQHLLNSLVEVVSAFDVGRGGTAMSYMGKGVTKNATLCLQHLTNEMASRALDQDWSSEWFETRQGKGLDWLMALWTYRDPEVRAAGLCIAAALTSTIEGCVTMATSCQHLPAGLWGVAFSILLDQSECSMVREQAANLLCNLLSKRFSDADTTASTDQAKSKAKWAGPQVHDEQSQVSLSGLPALLALLHHYHFYHGVASMLQHYYGQCTIQPVNVVEESTISTSVSPSGPSTVTTPGSNRSNRSNTSTPSVPHHTWASDMHSTSIMQTSPMYNGQQQSPQFGEPGRPVPNFQGNVTEVDETLISPSPSAPSSHPHITTSVGRFSSVVTTCLVSAVCRVLRNLMVHVQDDVVMGIAKEDILASLLRLFDSSQILELYNHYHGQVESATGSEILELQFAKSLSTYTEILKLVRLCAMQGGNQSLGNWDNDAVFNHCLQILLLRGVQDTGGEVWTSVSNVWEGIFDMMSVHLEVGGQVAWLQVLPLLQTHWKNITDCLIFLLKNPSPSRTRISALNFISMALSKSGSSGTSGKGVNDQDAAGINAVSTSEEREVMLGEVLDAKSSPKDSDCDSYGGALCEILLQAYDGVLPRSTSPLNGEKAAVLSALKNLLASSCEAQLTALKGGLVESTVNCLKDIHSKLSMDSLHINKSSKKKEEPLLNELSNQVHLLDCFMLANTDVKMAAYQAGLTTVIRKLWAWCTSERKLLVRVLSMLATYIARCPTACSSLAVGPPGQTGGSLLHNLVRQCQREKSRMQSNQIEEHAVAERLFAVLGNAVWSSECRSVLWKSGFLQGFAHTLPPKKKKLTMGHRQSATLWLRLIANLTFATEGQQMVLKISDCLDVLMEFGQCKDKTLHYLAVVVLHNLCFLNANKAKLLATDKLVIFLLDTLQSDSLDVQLAVLNALWALVHNSQKAKAVLKSTTLIQRLLLLQGQLRKVSALPSSIDAPYIHKCQQILSNLQILIQD